MNQLKIQDQTLDSRDVAEMMEVEHSKLLRNIRTHIEYLNDGGEANFGLSDFFKESSYLSEQNKEQPNYQITRKGCELLAHKMTGRKGTQFTAKYIQKFHAMEDFIKKDTLDLSQLSPELQLMNTILQGMAKQELSQKALEGKLNETQEEIKDIREVVEIKPFENWREDTTKQINKICLKNKDYREVRNKIYEALDSRAGTKIKIRLDNMRARAILAGSSKSKAESLSYLDVIAEDKKLIEIYTAIVKEMAIKKGVV